MTLFQRAAPNPPKRGTFEFDFQKILNKYYDGKPHEETIGLLDLVDEAGKTKTDTEEKKKTEPKPEPESESESEPEQETKKKIEYAMDG